MGVFPSRAFFLQMLQATQQEDASASEALSTNVAGHFSQSVRKNFFEGFFEEYDEEYDEEYALDFRPQRAQEACNGDAAFCAFWLLEASDSQSSFQRSQQMTEILSS